MGYVQRIVTTTSSKNCEFSNFYYMCLIIRKTTWHFSCYALFFLLVNFKFNQFPPQKSFRTAPTNENISNFQCIVLSIKQGVFNFITTSIMSIKKLQFPPFIVLENRSFHCRFPWLPFPSACTSRSTIFTVIFPIFRLTQQFPVLPLHVQDCPVERHPPAPPCPEEYPCPE